MASQDLLDLLIVGGGINGAGIARDAAGRGLKVALVEARDIAASTSSASSKLIHGGLRYLEHYAFRLVREALAEREVLLANAPHIIWPLRFVLPHTPELRPAWMLRLGLLLYDSLGWTPGRPASRLPRSQGVDLTTTVYGKALAPAFRRGFVYSDCWADDARLCVLNTRDAADRGATILTRTRLADARRAGDRWHASVVGPDGTTRPLAARGLVNAAGPWVGDVLAGAIGENAPRRTRLIKGSHIVVPRIEAGEHAFILQNVDRRIVFVIPYEERFTLIGTTDIPFDGDPQDVAIGEDEIDYLCDAANRYLARPIARGDIVWSYSGVRPLYDDGQSDASAVTRDYVLELAGDRGAPLLSVFGGKITTYRRLAEHALEKLAPFFPSARGAWTASAPLPGGDIADARFDVFLDELRRRHAWLDGEHLRRLARRHGTRLARVLGDAARPEDLGAHFGHGLYAREIEFLRREEWAQSAEDILWRRTKAGLHLGPEQRRALEAHLAATPAR